MKDQIEKLKRELREFIKLSKSIQGKKWYYWDQSSNDFIATGKHKGTLICALANFASKPKEFTFIARSRNISPAMAECLLSQIEWLEQCAIPVESANQQLQQILTIWEASK